MYVTDWLVINSGTYNVKRDVVTVESNDTLYGYDAKFIAEVNSMLTTVIDEITSQLKELEQTQVSTAEIVGIGQFCFLRVCSCVGSCYYEHNAQACYCCRLYQNLPTYVYVHRLYSCSFISGCRRCRWSCSTVLLLMATYTTTKFFR